MNMYSKFHCCINFSQRRLSWERWASTATAVAPTGAICPIRLIAVRETGVSRHQGGSIEDPLKLPVHHSTIILRWLIMWIHVEHTTDQQVISCGTKQGRLIGVGFCKYFTLFHSVCMKKPFHTNKTSYELLYSSTKFLSIYHFIF